uniref:Tc1-like transposase DDE domain-containing protein n=1 Tax=Oncorhynchus tshawytscha TaxID=74940 RepID=A0AAZ3SVG6_ONCTS
MLHSWLAQFNIHVRFCSPTLCKRLEFQFDRRGTSYCTQLQGNLNAVRYRGDLLPHVVPFLRAHPDMTLQHDNATSHTARSVRDFLQDRTVNVLPWPAKSPDLNPIEHIWDLLDQRVRAIPPRNVWELAGALVEEWGNISQQELANLVYSVRRCTAVINAAGGHTHF